MIKYERTVRVNKNAKREMKTLNFSIHIIIVTMKKRNHVRL